MIKKSIKNGNQGAIKNKYGGLKIRKRVKKMNYLTKMDTYNLL